MSLIFEKTVAEHRCTQLPQSDIPTYQLAEQYRRQTNNQLPEIAEVDLVRHYTNLSKQTFGVDNGFYPLGSCTMKYNPKVNEAMAQLPGFTKLHPEADVNDSQGALKLIYETASMLSEVTGMDNMNFQPGAGAHGEFTGLLLIKKYHHQRHDFKRKNIIVPDSAHGTNPASAAMNGFHVINLASKDGIIDLEALAEVLDDKTAGLMLTNPNTLGIYDKNILKITAMVHQAGGLCYYDGANMNAIMGICKPGDMGFDCIHLNLHKTFATPHGGGGPGVGACGCKAFLAPYLPNPQVVENNGFYEFYNSQDSIGKVTNYYGNFLVLVRTLTYLKSLGADGLLATSQAAVLNANYVKNELAKYFPVAFENTCMHEFVLSLEKFKEKTGYSALDVCKRMIDYNMHPPTMYFPLIIKEALMIEPTETESKQTLDEFIRVMKKIYEEAVEQTVDLSQAPFTTKYHRMDEKRAALKPILKYSIDEKIVNTAERN